MVSLTNYAAKKVLELISKKNLKGYGLRIAIVGGGLNGFEYTLSFNERPSETDIIFLSNGVMIFVDPFSYTYLKGTTIDYVQIGNEEGFVFKNLKPQSLH